MPSGGETIHRRSVAVFGPGGLHEDHATARARRAAVECHIVFAEPEAWFGGKNLLRSKLPLAVQDEDVRSSRRKLADETSAK